jgi:hypothetical protein
MLKIINKLKNNNFKEGLIVGLFLSLIFLIGFYFGAIYVFSQGQSRYTVFKTQNSGFKFKRGDIQLLTISNDYILTNSKLGIRANPEDLSTTTLLVNHDNPYYNYSSIKTKIKYQPGRNIRSIGIISEAYNSRAVGILGESYTREGSRDWHFGVYGYVPANTARSFAGYFQGKVVINDFDPRGLLSSNSASLGINTTEPRARLEVMGDLIRQTTAIITSGIRQTGGTGVYRSDWPNGWDGGLATWDINAAGIHYDVLQRRSDISLKKDIEYLNSDILNKILNLKPISFHWKNQNHNEKKHFGFIAQEVEKIFPELVMSDNEGKKNLNYEEIIPLLVKSIQEQQKIIDKLQTEIKILKEDKN